jgi:hypothetical protein
MDMILARRWLGRFARIARRVNQVRRHRFVDRRTVDVRPIPLGEVCRLIAREHPRSRYGGSLDEAKKAALEATFADPRITEANGIPLCRVCHPLAESYDEAQRDELRRYQRPRRDDSLPPQTRYIPFPAAALRLR